MTCHVVPANVAGQRTPFGTVGVVFAGLASWLDTNGEDGAAASLREGLDETLTVMRLNLPAGLRRTFATTNPIENMNGSLRRIARNVKRWKDEAMIRRWVALGIAEAQKRFRRVKGYVHMPSLVAAFRPRGDGGVRDEGRVAVPRIVGRR